MSTKKKRIAYSNEKRKAKNAKERPKIQNQVQRKKKKEGGGSTLCGMICPLYPIRLNAYCFYHNLPGLSIILVVGR